MRSCRQDLVDKILRDAEEVRVLSSAEYWERMHRLRCLALYQVERVVISEQLPEGTDALVYSEIKAIGNRVCNAIERHEASELGKIGTDDVQSNPIAAMAGAWAAAVQASDKIRSANGRTEA
jgi:hypothetical protein